MILRGKALRLRGAYRHANSPAAGTDVIEAPSAARRERTEKIRSACVRRDLPRDALALPRSWRACSSQRHLYLDPLGGAIILRPGDVCDRRERLVCRRL